MKKFATSWKWKPADLFICICVNAKMCVDMYYVWTERTEALFIISIPSFIQMSQSDSNALVSDGPFNASLLN